MGRMQSSRMPLVPLAKTSGFPCSTKMVWKGLEALSVKTSKAPSLNTLQFW